MDFDYLWKQPSNVLPMQGKPATNPRVRFYYWRFFGGAIHSAYFTDIQGRDHSMFFDDGYMRRDAEYLIAKWNTQDSGFEYALREEDL